MSRVKIFCFFVLRFYWAEKAWQVDGSCLTLHLIIDELTLELAIWKLYSSQKKSAQFLEKI